jgi:hypothetical protein
MDVEQSDVVVFGSRQTDGTFLVHEVIKGDESLDSTALTSPAIELGDGPRLLFGQHADAGAIRWTKSALASGEVLKFLSVAMRAPTAGPDRLRTFWPYLASRDPRIADDAYYQFAKSEYPHVREFARLSDRREIVAAIESPETLPHFRILMFRLLGVCGESPDAEIAWKLITADQAGKLRGLETVIASYLSLARQEGLEKIRQHILSNPKVGFAVLMAAIEAIRFHVTNEDRIPREELARAMHDVLDHREIADVALSELAEWHDWSAVAKAVDLFRNAPPDRRWLRVAAAKYLLACPLSTVRDSLAMLEPIDASAIQQARTGEVPVGAIRRATELSSPGPRVVLWLTSPWVAFPGLAVVIGVAGLMVRRHRIRRA